MEEQVATAGDSSSAESSFRELDDGFLQNQTRIWLGEVLQTRLNEQINVADLLADGELLFKVSRKIWKMLLANQMELRCVKAYKHELFASRKSSGRYMPYSNVDSFLKICKILGLAGIDLFSPSDVVEKRDTRKVCMCIRSLSKKARSRLLNVPDFDIVTCMVAMPTDMVGYIRRSWELSHCSSSSSASHSPDPESRCRSRSIQMQPQEEIMIGILESDDTESNLLLQSDASATSSYYNSSQMNSDLINSPGVSSVITNYSLKQWLVQLDDQNQQKYEYTECQWDTVCSNKPPGHLHPQQLEYDCQQDSMQCPSFVASNIQLGGRVSHAENLARNSYKNCALDLTYVNPNLKDGVLAVADSADVNTPRSNHIDDQLAMSNIVFHGNYTNDCILLDGASTGSCGSKVIRSTSGNEFQNRSNVDDMEVSSIADMCSVSGAVQHLDFDYCSDAEDDTKHVWLPESPNNMADPLSPKPMKVSKLQDKVVYESSEHRLTSDNEDEAPSDMKVKDTRFSSKHFLPSSDMQYTARYLDHAFSLNNGIFPQLNSNGVDDKGKELFAGHSCFPFEFHQWDRKGKCRIAEVPIGDDGHGASSLPLTQLDSHKETIHVIENRATGDALWIKNLKSVVTDKEVHGATMVESDSDGGEQPNKCFRTSCFDNTMDETIEDSSASLGVLAIVESENFHKPGSVDDDSCFHDQDMVIGHGKHVLDRVTYAHSNGVVSQIPGEPRPNKHTRLVTEYSQNVYNYSDQIFTDGKKDLIYSAENMDKDDGKNEKVQKLRAENSKVAEKAECKSHRRPLLKSVAKGTAVLGVLLFLLHLRKNGREKTGESGKQSNQIQKENRERLSSLKGREGSRVDGIYPVERLKFSD